MTEGHKPSPIKVICVDDNPAVTAALQGKLSRTPGFEWLGSAANADQLIPLIEAHCPCVVILDLDMPGRASLDALKELSEKCPHARTVVFSGHVRQELIDQALSSGAWGYVSKNDGENALIDALRAVAAGEFVLSTAVRAVLEG